MTNNQETRKMEMRIVTIPAFGDRRFKQWAKALKKVDTSKKNGYAFEGDFLRINDLAELPVGSYVLSYGKFGSRANCKPAARLQRVEANGSLTDIVERTGLSESWTLEVRDEIASIVNAEASEAAEENLLAGFSDEELLAEIKRRGLR